MNLLYCSICHDPQHAEAFIHDAERIAMQIESYCVQKFPYEAQDQSLACVRNDAHHPHFMCGTCMKLDAGKINRANEAVQNAVFSLCRNVEEGLVSPERAREASRHLSGYYPMLYKIIERVVVQKKSEQ